MKQVKTYRQLQSEVTQLYTKLRPRPYDFHWTDKPLIRKKIDKLLDKKYVEVE